MAPALTSNSFRLSPGGGARLHSKPEPRNLRTATVAAQARQNPFSFGKQPKDGASPEDEEKGEGKPKFFIDFGKLPDAKSLVPVVTSPPTSLFASPRRKDPRTVFVAGATGQAGVRIALALLRQGFSVRAGVPDLPSAQELARVASVYKIISPEESKRLNTVEAEFEDAESIAKAIGPATKVVVTVGAAEKGTSADVTTDDALEVVRAAKLAGVGHVAVVYNAGPGGFATQSTNNVLDGITSFFSNLFARTEQLTLGEFLSKMAELDLSYTLIKATLTEDYAEESAYQLVVSKEGSAEETPSEFKVSKSQIASLVADVFSNTSIAENKVVKVSTSPSATSKPIEELFGAIPEDGRRRAYAEAMAKAKAEEAQLAAEKAREAEEASKKLEGEVKKTRSASVGKEAWQGAEDAVASFDSLFIKAKGLSTDFSWDKLSSQLAAATALNSTTTASVEKKTKTQIATIRGQTKARTLPPKKAVVKKQPPPQKSKPNQQPAAAAEVKNIFGGLFKQETIYVDDD
ncbi:protein plastid transcriptionally active 16, chloroplastic [Canna indica]|uniref:Protein plastid transcriptionally active 16, chloroplastic n=1 Tax=Canna indica TaxID=4628 RepID=A0AAQ3KE71_9LILI|nr:protein plastid transcriptionally active 16, chloroplastic [Canna indica]